MRQLRAHLQFHIDDHIAAGLSPEEAQRQAWLALGGVEATCERVHERRGLPLATWIAQDCRYALRALRRSMLLSCVTGASPARRTAGSPRCLRRS